NAGYENYGVAKLTRPKIVNEDARYLDAFVGDTLTWSTLTVNLGLRWDRQESRNLRSSVPANPAFPLYLPAIDYAGSTGWDVDFRDWQPRAGLTYVLGEHKTTLLRASYARFADQLGATTAQFVNPIGYQYLYYYWTDTNGNHRPDPGELTGFYGAYGVDPNNPGSAVSPNVISRNLKDTTTDEFMVGIDHQIVPEFVAGRARPYPHPQNLASL